MFDQTLRGFKECNPEEVVKKPSFNTFAALGQPSSFHNPFVRALRRMTHSRIEGILSRLEPEGYRMQVIDRMLKRVPGDKAGSEGYHRDVSPGVDTKIDHVFGGWINLSSEDQKFTAVPGTHLDEFTEEYFAKVDDASYKSREKVYIIKPGEQIVFYQWIVHRVTGQTIKKNDNPAYRLFTGYVVTKDKDALKRMPNLIYHLDTQETPYLPGGNIADLGYGRRFRPKQFEEWSKRIFNDVIHSRVVRKPFPQGFSARKDWSLEALGIKYEEYDEEEKKLYTLQPNTRVFSKATEEVTEDFEEKYEPIDEHIFFDYYEDIDKYIMDKVEEQTDQPIHIPAYTVEDEIDTEYAAGLCRDGTYEKVAVPVYIAPGFDEFIQELEEAAEDSDDDTDYVPEEEESDIEEEYESDEEESDIEEQDDDYDNRDYYCMDIIRSMRLDRTWNPQRSVGHTMIPTGSRPRYIFDAYIK